MSDLKYVIAILIAYTFISCKVSDQQSALTEVLEVALEESELYYLKNRVKNCDSSIVHMKRLMKFDSVSIISDNYINLNYKLAGIPDAKLSSDYDFRYFHLSPSCFEKRKYKDVFELPRQATEILDSIFSKRYYVRVGVKIGFCTPVLFGVTGKDTIRFSGWGTHSNYPDKIMKVEEFHLVDNQDDISIEYTSAIIKKR